jgi:hypothetical protein
MIKSIETELGKVQEIVIKKMKFLYMEVSNDVESQKEAWPVFESKFPNLTGRKMYGLDYGDEKRYRVCSLVLESDNGLNYGCKMFSFEGGAYLRLRLKFDQPLLFEKIGPAYNYLFTNYSHQIDWTMPTIEHYKAHNVLDIMIPITKA